METKVCFFGWEGAPATMNDVIGRFKRLVTILGSRRVVQNYRFLVRATVCGAIVFGRLNGKCQSVYMYVYRPVRRDQQCVVTIMGKQSSGAEMCT